jgi:cytoskeletal protein CcmA (bactofilin family)
MFNRKQDPGSKDPVPFQLRRPDGDTGGQAQPPQIPTQTAYQPSSVIGSDLSIEGQSITIRCQGLLTVNGDINADVHSKQIEVGQDGSISGGVSAENVDVHGKVRGSIHGARVVLHPTADVEGDIHTQFLTIQEGASFDGRSRKVRDLAEVAPQLERPGASQPVYQQPGASGAQPQAPKPQFGVAPPQARPLHS